MRALPRSPSMAGCSRVLWPCRQEPQRGYRDQHERCGNLQPWPRLWWILFPLGQGGFELARRLWPLRRIR